MVQVGDWVRIHEDALQDEPYIPSDVSVRVTQKDLYTINVSPPEGCPTKVYWHHEYDVVEPPYLVGDPPSGITPRWVATTTTNPICITLPAEPDLGNEPPHYKIRGDMEVIDVIEALAKDDAWYANAIKYLLRAKKKGKLAEDLGKCKFYIDRMLRDAESEAN
jgi:hypothetical protein